MTISTSARVAVFAVVAAALAAGAGPMAQTREKGPWWPSPHGPKDQAGNSNYVTAEKIDSAVPTARTSAFRGQKRAANQL